MTDFSDFDSYDSSWTDLSNGYADLSNDMWTQSIDFTNYANDAWLQGDMDTYSEFYQAAENSEWYSNRLEQASWDAWYGPVNSEGYTAYDASMGYTSTDTSFIEPASSAGSVSMISDNNATSWL